MFTEKVKKEYLVQNREVCTGHRNRNGEWVDIRPVRVKRYDIQYLRCHLKPAKGVLLEPLIVDIVPAEVSYTVDYAGNLTARVIGVMLIGEGECPVDVEGRVIAPIRGFPPAPSILEESNRIKEERAILREEEKAQKAAKKRESVAQFPEELRQYLATVSSRKEARMWRKFVNTGEHANSIHYILYNNVPSYMDWEEQPRGRTSSEDALRELIKSL